MLACKRDSDLLEDLQLMVQKLSLSLCAGLTSGYVTRQQHSLSRRLLLFLWIYGRSHHWCRWRMQLWLLQSGFIPYCAFPPRSFHPRRSRRDRAASFCVLNCAFIKPDWLNAFSLSVTHMPGCYAQGEDWSVERLVVSPAWGNKRAAWSHRAAAGFHTTLNTMNII